MRCIAGGIQFVTINFNLHRSAEAEKTRLLQLVLEVRIVVQNFADIHTCLCFRLLQILPFYADIHYGRIFIALCRGPAYVGVSANKHHAGVHFRQLFHLCFDLFQHALRMRKGSAFRQIDLEAEFALADRGDQFNTQRTQYQQ